MKGIELPINVLIIIAIGVVVLLSVTALYFAGWIPGAGSINLENVKTTSCRELFGRCNNDVNLVTINNFDADSDGEIDPGTAVGDCSDSGGPAEDNLLMLCKCYYSANENECRDICMCKELASSSPPMPPPPP